ncbi:uncharacterized protein LAJ45_08977 [Morchella importuna]|uniref:uncharacterized protein n=1 Tax=Morchella importuna TaxID=1174673 RepID=UPI001E8CA5CC|nr:uncharacterized protein LAJ45_08977 [Morchella importuna]KAH8146898.1 hypothetical protein LAJ45_08977 [Morchella importuna]
MSPVEYCAEREKTIHSHTTDKVFRCCGERVPPHLLLPGSRNSTKVKREPIKTIAGGSASAPPTESRPNRRDKGKGKASQNIETILLLSSPTNSPERIVKTESKKQNSTFGLVPALTSPAPASKQSALKITARDSRKLVIYVGSLDDKWSSYKNIGVSSKVFEDLDELITDHSDFAFGLLSSSPNWQDAITAESLDIHQVLVATHFHPKDGPHRLEVRSKPITVRDFLMDFPGGPSTKIVLVVKYQTDLDEQRAIRIKKEKEETHEFLTAVRARRDRFDSPAVVKKELYMRVGEPAPSPEEEHFTSDPPLLSMPTLKRDSTALTPDLPEKSNSVLSSPDLQSSPSPIEEEEII